MDLVKYIDFLQCMHAFPLLQNALLNSNQNITHPNNTISILPHSHDLDHIINSYHTAAQIPSTCTHNSPYRLSSPCHYKYGTKSASQVARFTGLTALLIKSITV